MDSSHPLASDLSSDAVDDVFAILSNEECCRVIRYFRQVSGSAADFDSLVEYSVRLADGSADREKRAIALHHVALPKLAERGVLDYDTRTETVRYRGCPVVERLLDRTVELEGESATVGDRREAARKHLEDAVQADESATKDYHIREALQFLSIADERHGDSDDAEESAE